MSENDNNVENKVTKNRFSLTDKVLAFFNLTDGGKVDSFLIGLEKSLSRTIKTINQNINTKVLEHESVLEDISDSIEDAKLAVEDAWKNINPEKLGSKSEQKDFQEDFMRSIESAEARVDVLIAKKDNMISAHALEITELENQVCENKRRITKLGSL